MKYAFWGFGIIMAGLFGIIFIVMFESITVNNESEYYTLKEAMEASMLEAIDWACYRNTNPDTGCNGEIKISEQKFVENFTRRFASNVSGDVTSYTVDFYDIIEKPPKATIVVTGNTKTYVLSTNGAGDDFDLVNDLSGILEAKSWSVEKNKK